MKTFIQIAVCALALTSCIELDFFLFDGEVATSIEEDYHGLPLYNGDQTPAWISSTQVEREIYLSAPSAQVIPPDALDEENNYIHGVFIHAPSDCPVEQCPLINDSVTFLYQHGNSGHMYRYWYRAVALWNLGANVFVYTYRGYGLSRGSGDISRQSILSDANTAMNYVRGRDDVDADRIVAYGYSMGGIPTSYLVGESESKNNFLACILESALDSPSSSVNLSTSTEFPDGFFLDEAPFDGPEFIKGSSLPILHMHGGEDSRVLIVQARQYYDVLKDRSNYTHYVGKSDKPDEEWLKGAGHRNITISSFMAEYHIPDYWEHNSNPSHCCVHPLEYSDSEHSDFLDEIGKTSGAEMLTTHQLYRNLVANWVTTVLPNE